MDNLKWRISDPAKWLPLISLFQFRNIQAQRESTTCSITLLSSDGRTGLVTISAPYCSQNIWSALLEEVVNTSTGIFFSTGSFLIATSVSLPLIIGILISSRIRQGSWCCSFCRFKYVIASRPFALATNNNFGSVSAAASSIYARSSSSSSMQSSSFGNSDMVEEVGYPNIQFTATIRIKSFRARKSPIKSITGLKNSYSLLLNCDSTPDDN